MDRFTACCCVCAILLAATMLCLRVRRTEPIQHTTVRDELRAFPAFEGFTEPTPGPWMFETRIQDTTVDGCGQYRNAFALSPGQDDLLKTLESARWFRWSQQGTLGPITAFVSVQRGVHHGKDIVTYAVPEGKKEIPGPKSYTPAVIIASPPDSGTSDDDSTPAEEDTPASGETGGGGSPGAATRWDDFDGKKFRWQTKIGDTRRYDRKTPRAEAIETCKTECVDDPNCTGISFYDPKHGKHRCDLLKGFGKREDANDRAYAGILRR